MVMMGMMMRMRRRDGRKSVCFGPGLPGGADWPRRKSRARMRLGVGGAMRRVGASASGTCSVFMAEDVLVDGGEGRGAAVRG